MAVTHGRSTDPMKVAENAKWAISTLRRCIVKAIETGRLPNMKDLLFS